VTRAVRSAEPARARATSLPRHRSILALDIEQSTDRPDPVKAELRRMIYQLFGQALRSAGIRPCHYDPFVDRGDGFLVLVHPVDQVPKAVLLSRVVPELARCLADYNAGLPRTIGSQRRLRIRVVVHAGEVHYDERGVFGEALDIAFRLLDAPGVKKALRMTIDPLTLVISGDIYRSVVRQGYEGIDQHTFHPLIRVRVAGQRHPGWVQVPPQPSPVRLAELVSHRQPA
jgi:class 3 adenylate cyclase